MFLSWIYMFSLLIYLRPYNARPRNVNWRAAARVKSRAFIDFRLSRGAPGVLKRYRQF